MKKINKKMKKKRKNERKTNENKKNKKKQKNKNYLKQVREKSVGNIYKDDKRNQAYEGYNGV